MDGIPKNDGYAELSPRERKLLCDAAALGEYAERALNDPTILAGRDALQEEFRLEREAKPVRRRLEIVRRKLESVNFFVSPHKDSPSITLGVNLGRSLEVTLADLQYAEKTLRQVLSSLPAPPALQPIEQEARKAWECFPDDPEPLDFFIRERLGLKRNARGPIANVLRHRVWALLDRCFAPLPFYRSGEWFLLGPRETAELSDLLDEHWKEYPELERALSNQGMTTKEEHRKLLQGVTFCEWKSLHPTLTFRDWRNGHRNEHSPTLLNAVSNHLRKEGGTRRNLRQKAFWKRKRPPRQTALCMWNRTMFQERTRP